MFNSHVRLVKGRLLYSYPNKTENETENKTTSLQNNLSDTNDEDTTMKTLSTLIFAATAAFAVNANAGTDALHGDPAINDVFPIQEISLQPQSIKSVADTGKQVWSIEYEEYVNPADFNLTSQNSVASMLQELENNPPAAGGTRTGDIFKWDSTADEYQLQ